MIAALVTLIILTGLIGRLRVGAIVRRIAILVHGLRRASFVRLPALMLSVLARLLRSAIASAAASTSAPATAATTTLSIALLSILRMAVRIGVHIPALLIELLLIVVSVVVMPLIVLIALRLHGVRGQRGRHRAVFVTVIAHQNCASLGLDTANILRAGGLCERTLRRALAWLILAMLIAGRTASTTSALIASRLVASPLLHAITTIGATATISPAISTTASPTSPTSAPTTAAL